MYVHNIMHYINYVTDKGVEVYYLYLSELPPPIEVVASWSR